MGRLATERFIFQHPKIPTLYIHKKRWRTYHSERFSTSEAVTVVTVTGRTPMVRDYSGLHLVRPD